MRRIIVPVFSDTHGGGKFSLMNPAVTLYEEDEQGNQKPWHPEPTASQEYLWEVYQEGIDRARALAGMDEVISFHNGDECQGNKHAAALVSTRMADQMLIAAANMQPWFSLPTARRFRMVSGTEAHDFTEGTSTRIVTELLSARNPLADVKSYNHGLVDLDGLSVDISHHGPGPGLRSWLQGNVARFYLRDLMIRELVAGRTPPRLVFRAHVHAPIVETLTMGDYTSTLIVTPSFSMLSPFAMKVTQSINCLTNGMVIAEIIDGRLANTYDVTRTVDIRTVEKL